MCREILTFFSAAQRRQESSVKSCHVFDSSGTRCRDRWMDGDGFFPGNCV